jgi:hypothetical protein
MRFLLILITVLALLIIPDGGVMRTSWCQVTPFEHGILRKQCGLADHDTIGKSRCSTKRLDGHGTAECALRVNVTYGKSHAVAPSGSLSSVVRRKYATAATAVPI